MGEDNANEDRLDFAGATIPRRWPVWLATGLLVLLVASVFYRVSWFEFIDFDTYELVVENPYIQELTYENLKHILTSREMAGYYPVRTLSYALNRAICGLHPGGFKIVNVLIHLANTLLVFWLARRLLADPAAGDRSIDPRWDVALATFAGAVFAVHPVVVEPVVWIPGREELLTTLGSLGTVHFHISAWRLADGGGRRQTVWLCHLGAVLCCTAACLSHVTAVIVPAIAATWDLLMVRRRKWLRMALGTGPLWLIALVALVSRTVLAAEEPINLIELTLKGRALVGLNAYWLHLETLVWPKELLLFYDWLYPSGFLDPGVLLGIVSVVGSLLSLWFFRRRPLVLFGVVCFGIGLAPTLQIIPHHIHRADRFLYVPLIGVAVAVAAVLRLLVERIEKRLLKTGLSVALGGIVIALAVRSSFQVSVWSTSLGVWQHCLALDPDNARAHDAVGDHFTRHGNPREAASHYETVLRLRPNALETLENFGWCLATWEPPLRDFDRAVELVTRAHDRTKGKLRSVRETLADIHLTYAQHLQETKQYARAIQEYEKALEVDTDYADAAFNLALLLATCPDDKLRRPEAAVSLAEWAQGRDRRPTVNKQLILATAYAQAGRPGAAVVATTRALDLAKAMGDAKLAADLEKQIRQYQEHPH